MFSIPPLSAPLTPPTIPPPVSGREEGIDALRALAALLVVGEHLTQQDYLPISVQAFGSGREGVLLFFVISGYVIGRVNRRPAVPASFKDYWRRRLLRLCPLYLVAVAFSFAVGNVIGQPASVASGFGHLVFLQNFEPYFGLGLAPLKANPALWTLNCEMVFYALFLLVWRFTPKAGPLFALCALPPLLAPWLPVGTHFLLSYAVGFTFWLSGLALAWMPPGENSQRSSFPVFGCLFALVAAYDAAPWSVLLDRLGIDQPQPWVSFGDFIALPYCVALVGGAAGLFTFPRRLRILCLLPGAAVLSAAALTGHDLSDQRWLGVTVYTLLAAILLFVPTPSSVLRRLAPWGLVSYAVYLFHTPVLYLLQHLLGGPWGSLLLLPVILPLAWYLETRFQPLFVARLTSLRLRPHPSRP